MEGHPPDGRVLRRRVPWGKSLAFQSCLVPFGDTIIQLTPAQ